MTNEVKKFAQARRECWGNSEYEVVARITASLKLRGFENFRWSDERPSRFSLSRIRSGLIHEISFEGQTSIFTCNFMICSKDALDIANIADLDSCVKVFPGIPWPPLRENWGLLTAGMATLMAKCLRKRPTPVFYLDERYLSTTVFSFLENFDDLLPYFFDAFESALTAADFLTGKEAPPSLKSIGFSRENIFTGLRGYGVYIDAALAYASYGSSESALRAIDLMRASCDLALARGDLSLESHRQWQCQQKKLLIVLASTR
jgi:hypothetical protein